MDTKASVRVAGGASPMREQTGQSDLSAQGREPNCPRRVGPQRVGAFTLRAEVERTKRTTLPPAIHIGTNGIWVRSMGKMPPSTRPSVTLRFADDLLIALDTVAVQLSSTVRPSGVERPLVCLGHLLMTDAGVGFEALTIQDG
jgi:hypothetical protein